MPLPRITAGCALLAALLLAPIAYAAKEKPSASSPPPTPPTVLSKDRVIVEWASGASHADRVDAREGADVDFESDLGNRGFQLVEVERGQTASGAVHRLEANPAVVVAERDGYSSPNAIPDDPLFGELWGLRNTGLGIGGFPSAIAGDDIDAPGAWVRTVGDPSTVIADIDSGYRFNDPELGSVAWTNVEEASGAEGVDEDGNGYVDDVHGYDFVGPDADSPTNDKDPTDDNLISGGHGVHTAGTMGAAGNNGTGITGVAGDARIMPLRVCANSPSAENEARCPFSSQVAAINYAGDMGARAANMSLGGTSFVTSVRDAIAANPETLYVISAGNDGEDNDSVPHYPCNYNPLAEGQSTVDNVICVAATDQADELANFSDWGSGSVDLAAPGTETLSTYPGVEISFHDDFETSNFAATWSKTGAEGFGRAGSGDGPLTSFGMSDSPGATPLPGSVHDTTLTTGVSVPAGSGACTLRGKRYRHGGSGGAFYYQVLSDGSSAFFNNTSTATPTFAMTPFNTAPILGLAGHSVKLRFGFTAGSSPGPGDGIWFDDLEITCYKSAAAPLSYRFLQGTSMAAPHVTGAAALLFSMKPSATVSEVKNALLSTVDPVASLTGITTTGGRLNVSQAIDVFDTEAPPPPHLSTAPTSPANDNHPKIVGSAEEGSTVSLYMGAKCEGAPIATGSAAELAAPGFGVTVPDNSATEFSATATDTALNTSSCSPPVTYVESTGETIVNELPPGTVEEAEAAIARASPPSILPAPTKAACMVPKLVGKTLGLAKGALIAAGCKLGHVRKPRAKKGRKRPALVVKSSTPGVGAHPANGSVDLTLGPKPKPKRHRRHR